MNRPLGWLNPTTLGRPHFGRAVPPVMGSGLSSAKVFCHLGNLPPVYDQGQVGSCVANALAGAVEIVQSRSGYQQQRPDRMALYYRERQMEGTVNEDAGAIIADGIAVLRAGYEVETAYDPTWSPAWTQRPPRRDDNAPRLVNAEPLAIDEGTIAWELACGHPVAVGLHVTEAWQTLRGDTLPDPSGAGIGGHAVLLVGYDLTARVWIMRNSWGAGWGDGGYARLPWSWTSLPWCGEAHSIRAVREAP